MNRRVMRNLAMTTAALLLIALPASTQEAQEDPLAELVARAEEAEGGKRAKLYAELAEKRVELANKLFYAGENAEGHEAVEQAVEAAERAGEAARESRKRMKQTEISIRKTARRLDDIMRTLAYDDRPRVERAVETMEEVRRDILGTMFAPKKDRS